MEKVVLKANKRDVVGKQVGALRRAGKLPAVLYGHRIESTPIVLNAHETALTLSRLSSSSLVTIDLDGKKYPALVRDQQRECLKNILMHVDFQVISMTEKLRTKVGVELHGTAPAVKEFNAVIVPGLTELEVECMPQDLPERIVVDISGLTEIGASVRVRDLALSGQVEVLVDQDEVLAVASPPARAEVVEEAPAEEAAPEAAAAAPAAPKEEEE